MSGATQRKAWNEAMRSAGAVLPPSASLPGGAAASGRGVAGRASDRRRRRDRARKSSAAVAGAGGGAVSSLEEREHRAAVRLDALEGATGGDRGDLAGGDDDDEYDEFAELDDGGDKGGVGGRGRAKAKRKRKRKGGSGAGGKPPLPKYLRPRSLASILIEEASRPDSVAKQYVHAAVRRRGTGSQSTRTVDPEKRTVVTTYTNPYPSRKFCPVTGLFGEYTEPKSGIPYANLRALEQIRERHPPWMNAGSGGTAGYWEAVKSLRDGS